MIDDATALLIRFVGDAAPMVWEASIVMVRARALQYLLWALAMLVTLLVTAPACRYCVKWSHKDDGAQFTSSDVSRSSNRMGLAMILGGASVGSFIALFGCLAAAIARWISPEFYAALMIVQMFRSM